MAEDDTKTEDPKDAEIAKLKAQLTERDGQLADVKAESIDRRKQLDLWKKLGDSPDAVQTKLSEAAKGKNPDHEQVIADMRAGHEKELADLKSTIGSMRADGAAKDLKVELTKAGFVPAAVDGIASLAMQRIKFEDGNMQVVSPDGKPMAGSGADGFANLSDLAKSLTEQHGYALADAGKGGGGTPNNSNGGKPGQKSVTRSEFDAMSQADRAGFSKDGGKVVD